MTCRLVGLGGAEGSGDTATGESVSGDGFLVHLQTFRGEDKGPLLLLWDKYRAEAVFPASVVSGWIYYGPRHLSSLKEG